MWLWIAGALIAVMALIFAAIFVERLCIPNNRRGSIKGLLHIDGVPAPAGIPVRCWVTGEIIDAPRWLSPLIDVTYWDEWDDSDIPTFSQFHYAFTGDGGRFAFNRVPFGTARLERAYKPAPYRTHLMFWARRNVQKHVLFEHERTIEIQSEEPVDVTLGLGGMNIHGRFVGPVDHSGNLSGLVRHRATMCAVAAEPERPVEIPEEEHNVWWRDFLDTEEGRRWLDQRGRRYYLTVEQDGSFRAANVRPGQYRLDVELDSGPSATEASRRPFGRYTGEVEVPWVDEDSLPEFLDIGSLPLSLYTRLQPGDQLPTVNVTDFRDKPLQFVVRDGRFLLVSLSWPYQDMREARPDMVKLIHSLKATEKWLDVVVVSMDGQSFTEVVRKEGQPSNWKIKMVRDESSRRLALAFGVRSSAIFLFAPDGTLVEGKIPPKKLKSRLRALA